MLVAGLAVLLSLALFVGVLVLLVLVRRGAPARRTSPEYDASRRQAIRLLTGADPAHPVTTWHRDARRQAVPGDPLRKPFRAAVREALEVAVPAGRGLTIERDGTARLADARVFPEVSTAELRTRAREGSGLEIGLVLVNAEPPGDDPRRVALPVQVLFPALERAGRADLVARFGSLAERIP